MSARIFVDTSAIYALASSSDRFSQRAKSVYQGLLKKEEELFVTSYVFAESAGLITRRLGFEAFHSFVSSAEVVMEVVWIDQALHSRAWQRMLARNGAGLSLVDWTTVVAAETYSASVFAYDQDFDHEGLPVIR